MKRIIFLALVSLLNLTSLYCQNTYREYAAGVEDALLYRHAKIAPRYRFNYEGSPYVESDFFIAGDFVYDGVRYEDVLLNLNAEEDLLYLMVSENSRPLVMLTELVSSFTLGSKRYVNLSADGPGGNFYEILAEGGVTLYKYTQKVHFKTADGDNHTVRHSFDPKVKYYLYDGTSYKSVSSSRDIIKMFPDRKKEIKAFLKKSGLSPRHESALVTSVTIL